VLPDGPYKNLIQSLENPEEAEKLKTAQLPLGTLMRLKRVTQDFIQGANILTDMPSRDNSVLYYKHLIMGLRFLFCAFSSNTFFAPKGGKHDACTSKTIPGLEHKKLNAFTSAIFVEIPITFFPEGFSFQMQEFSNDSWAQRMLDRWRIQMEAGDWSKPMKETKMGTALEAEIIIMNLYVSACMAKHVEDKAGGRQAAGVLLARCHDLLCGLSYLLGIEKMVMPGPLSSGKFKPPAVKAKCTVPPSLAQVLNNNFLVKLMLDMSELSLMEKENIHDALNTITQCQSFESALWDSYARYLNFSIEFLKKDLLEQKF
jgi:hypothetical protein